MKQYLLLCDENALQTLKDCFVGIKYLEVEGLNLNAENKYQVLTTPIVHPLTPAFIEEPAKEDVAKDQSNAIES